MKYIFLDIDGTLYDHKNHGIPESAYRAVRLAKEKGHKIFICTGRVCCMLGHVQDIGYEGVVAAAGAYVEVNGKSIYEEYLSKTQLRTLLEKCEALGISYILEGRQGVYMHSFIREFYRTGKGKDTPGHEFFGQKQVHGMERFDENKESVFKISVYTGRKNALEEFTRQLSPDYQLVSSLEDERLLSGAELTLKKNNKASGIKTVLDYLGGDIKDTVAIGDSMNDLEMMQECAVSVAMGNADKRIKPFADYITSDIDKDGIYRAFAHFDLL